MTYKDIIEPFDIIIIYNPKSWLHKMIYKVTEYKAGHVALYLPGGNIAQAVSTGVCIKDLKDYDSNYKIYLARYGNFNSEIYRSLSISVENSLGKKYSYFQLIAMLFQYIFHINRIPDVSKSAMICSEFIAKTFEDADIDISFKPSWQVTPADIYNSKKLTIIETEA